MQYINVNISYLSLKYYKSYIAKNKYRNLYSIKRNVSSFERTNYIIVLPSDFHSPSRQLPDNNCLCLMSQAVGTLTTSRETFL